MFPFSEKVFPLFAVDFILTGGFSKIGKSDKNFLIFPPRDVKLPPENEVMCSFFLMNNRKGGTVPRSKKQLVNIGDGSLVKKTASPVPPMQ